MPAEGCAAGDTAWIQNLEIFQPVLIQVSYQFILQLYKAR
jgi:hypothetical protein